MKTVVISGASGFIGHHLCNKLFDSCQVIGIGNKSENQPKCHEFICANLNNIPWDLIPKIDICFHQGALNDTTETDRGKMFTKNLAWGIEFFEKLAQDKNCTKFIYASSCSVYGNESVPFKETAKVCPDSPYAESKVLFEKFAEYFSTKYNVKTIGLRYSNVYGPKENHKGKRASMISQILENIKTQKPIKLFKFGEQKRDWVYVADVVEANILAANLTEHSNEIFNVGSGLSLSFNDIIKIIERATNMASNVEYVDCPYKNYQGHTLVDLFKSANIMKYNPQYVGEKGIEKYIKKALD